MRRLLLEFGRKWITMDNELVKGQNRILEVLMEGEDEAVRGQIARKTAGLFRVENRFFDENEAEELENRLDAIKDLKKKYGGDKKEIDEYLQKISAEYDLLSDCEGQYAALTEKLQKKALKVLNFYQMIIQILQ